MSYQSIDTLQNVLGETVFMHTKDAKKAAGRCLGTLIEIITFHLLKEWGMQDAVSIERALPEYGNPDITHNVEFTLHPVVQTETRPHPNNIKFSAKNIAKDFGLSDKCYIKGHDLLDKDGTIRNACTIAESERYIYHAELYSLGNEYSTIQMNVQLQHPYAMFECKRVGVEEGMKKGPQTIEKAKQGAYVAKTTSALQKLRNAQGEQLGIIYSDGEPLIAPYEQLLQQIINGNDIDILKDFTLSVGIVSNHGNWFTSQDQNKELKVLAQSYDWLLFLTDEGLSMFITDLLLHPSKQNLPVRNAFLNSYKEGKKSNVFTKAKMEYTAHLALCRYFHTNIRRIERWFNVITPDTSDIHQLKVTLNTLQDKPWRY
ncbi:MAG: hypothetical protein IKQ85_07440 [Bacteroidaceae bacterium]|nr:hypothetical protein [Bacteroidaceae bacterium]